MKPCKQCQRPIPPYRASRGDATCRKCMGYYKRRYKIRTCPTCGKQHKSNNRNTCPVCQAPEVRAARGLIAKWRDDADGVRAMGYSQQAERMLDCADELANALAGQG